MSASAVELLAVEDIHTYYGEAHILQGVSVSVGAGEVVTLIGRNGAGKTTTLRSIMGIARPRAGRITLGGEEISRRPTHEIVRLGMGLVATMSALWASRIARSCGAGGRSAISSKSLWATQAGPSGTACGRDPKVTLASRPRSSRPKLD